MTVDPSGQNKLIPRKTIKAALLLGLAILCLCLLLLVISYLPQQVEQQSSLGEYLNILLFTFAGVLALIYLSLNDVELAGEAIALTVGLFLAAVVLLSFKGTAYSLNGDHGDQGMLIAQITKFSFYAKPVDFVYMDLPPFYPPLYALILGKLSLLAGLAPYKLVKYGLVGVVFLLPYLLHRAWRPLLDSRVNFFMPLIPLLFQNWYKPQEWLTVLLFVPWWIIYVEGEDHEPWPPKISRLAIGGFLGAVLFQSYYYWFFFGATSLISRLLLRRIFSPGFRLSPVDYRRGFLMLLSTMCFSIFYWGPVLLSFSKAGGFESLQNRYYLSELGLLQLPFLQLSINGIVLSGGLLYLVRSAKANKLSFSLFNLLLAAYVWQLVGVFGFYLNYPLLTFKSHDFIVYLLYLGAVIGFNETWYGIRKLSSNTVFVQPSHFFALLAFLFFGRATMYGLVNDALRPRAFSSSYPVEMVQSYERLTKNKPENQTVMGAGPSLTIYTPVFDFLAWGAHFSHPAALFHERVRYIEALSRMHDPVCFATALMNNKFIKIDHVLVVPTDGGYDFSYFEDAFPNGTEQRTISFASTVLESQYFERLKGDSWVFFTPKYALNPLTTVDSQKLDPCIARFDNYLKR